METMRAASCFPQVTGDGETSHSQTKPGLHSGPYDIIIIQLLYERHIQVKIYWLIQKYI